MNLYFAYILQSCITPSVNLAEEVRRKPQLEKRMRNAPPIAAAAAAVVTKQRSSSPSSWLSLSKLLPR
jgi:hypothetical protein